MNQTVEDKTTEQTSQTILSRASRKTGLSHRSSLDLERNKPEIDAREEIGSYAQSEESNINIRKELSESQDRRSIISEWVDCTYERFHDDNNENQTPFHEKNKIPTDNPLLCMHKAVGQS